jgi:hypothetical protein
LATTFWASRLCVFVRMMYKMRWNSLSTSRSWSLKIT